MIRFYTGSGAGGFSLHDKPLDTAAWERISTSASRLMRSRDQDQAAQLLETIPFQLYNATNHFNDEFCVLHTTVPMERYVELSELGADVEVKQNFKRVASTLEEIGYYVRHIAVELDINSGPVPVPAPSPKVTSETVTRALADAEKLLRSNGAPSAIDRAHTAFHGYLKVLCREENIAFADDAGVTQLFKALRKGHPRFKSSSTGDDQITRVTNAMAAITDALNPLRNNTSMAHPNETLLDEPEAMLVINSVRTLLHYLCDKLEQTDTRVPF